MPFTYVPVTPPITPPTAPDRDDLMEFVERIVEAPAPAFATDGLLGDLSHHADLDNTEDIVWLARELSQCDTEDWLDLGGGALACGVLPAPTPLHEFPQSPTSVDWPSMNAQAKPPGPRTRPHHHRKTKARVDNAAVKLAAMKLETVAVAATRNQWLDVKQEDDAKVELAHEKWVGGDMRLELNRRRQRGYEKKYRKKRQSTYKSMLDEWARKEMKHYTLLQQQASPWRVDGQMPSYDQLLQEERAARVDHMHMMNLVRWTRIFELHICKDGETLRTHDELDAVDRSLLGPSVLKPFCPFRHTFHW